MIIKIMNYQNKIVEEEIGDLNDIGAIFIKVISGDEIAVVIYKDYNVQYFHSDYASIDFDDGIYCIYNYKDKTDLLSDPKWLNRKDSYEFLW